MLHMHNDGPSPHLRLGKKGEQLFCWHQCHYLNGKFRLSLENNGFGRSPELTCCTLYTFWMPPALIEVALAQA